MTVPTKIPKPRWMYLGETEDQADARVNSPEYRERRRRISEQHEADMRSEYGPRWIPCTERMPEGGVDVLISVQGVAHIACLSQLSGNWIDAEDGWTKRDVTHWMPLPEGPE